VANLRGVYVDDPKAHPHDPSDLWPFVMLLDGGLCFTHPKRAAVLEEASRMKNWSATLAAIAAAVVPCATLVWLWLSSVPEPTWGQLGVIFPPVAFGGPILGLVVYNSLTRSQERGT
jgi:hypothetical protein